MNPDKKSGSAIRSRPVPPIKPRSGSSIGRRGSQDEEQQPLTDRPSAVPRGRGRPPSRILAGTARNLARSSSSIELSGRGGTPQRASARARIPTPTTPRDKKQKPERPNRMPKDAPCHRSASSLQIQNQTPKKLQQKTPSFMRLVKRTNKGSLPDIKPPPTEVSLNDKFIQKISQKH